MPTERPEEETAAAAEEETPVAGAAPSADDGVPGAPDPLAEPAEADVESASDDPGESESFGEGEPSPLSFEDARGALEALLYAAGDPMSLRELKKALPEAAGHLKEAVAKLQEDYARSGRGLQIVEVAGGWQITTRPEYHEFVGRLFEGPKPSRLSLQALETLAVIAYRQPVTVPEIMELRGVRSAGVVRTLLEKKLVKIVGRKSVVGRPLLYGTTKEFLLRFGLKDIKDLPQLKDMSDVFGDEVSQQVEVLEALDAAAPEAVEEDAPSEPSESGDASSDVEGDPLVEGPEGPEEPREEELEGDDAPPAG